MDTLEYFKKHYHKLTIKNIGFYLHMQKKLDDTVKNFDELVKRSRRRNKQTAQQIFNDLMVREKQKLNTYALKYKEHDKENAFINMQMDIVRLFINLLIALAP
jgi:U3 small nucleolar RNA-associated protein 14